MTNGERVGQHNEPYLSRIVEEIETCPMISMNLLNVKAGDSLLLTPPMVQDYQNSTQDHVLG